MINSQILVQNLVNFINFIMKSFHCILLHFHPEKNSFLKLKQKQFINNELLINVQLFAFHASNNF